MVAITCSQFWYLCRVSECSLLCHEHIPTNILLCVPQGRMELSITYIIHHHKHKYTGVECKFSSRYSDFHLLKKWSIKWSSTYPHPLGEHISRYIKLGVFKITFIWQLFWPAHKSVFYDQVIWGQQFFKAVLIINDIGLQLLLHTSILLSQLSATQTTPTTFIKSIFSNMLHSTRESTWG